MGNYKLKSESGKLKMESGYKRENIVMNKSYAFALRIIKFLASIVKTSKNHNEK